MDYFIGFGSKATVLSGSEAYPGHAFAAFGQGTPLACSQNGQYEAWGFYGSANADFEYFIGNVKGYFLPENVNSPDLFFYINVSFDEYLKGLMVKDDFIKSTKDYNLYKRNCVSYVDAVAQTISDKINVPEKSDFIDLPTNYLAELIKINKNT